MSHRTTTSRGRRKIRGYEIVDLRQVINRRRQTALWTNEHVDNIEILESSGNNGDAEDITELSSRRPTIDYSDILLSSDDMTKDEWTTDFSGVIPERSRHIMFVGNEILKFSDDNEAFDPSVSNCNDNREISKRRDDGHDSRQVEVNEFSITSRMYNHVMTKNVRPNISMNKFDLKSIPLDRVCDSTKDESADIDREIMWNDEVREEREVYEDKYVQNKLIEDWSALRQYDHGAVGFTSMEYRQPDAKAEHGTNRWTDTEEQHVNNERSHFLQPSAEKEVSVQNIFHSKGKREISNKGLVNSDCHRSGHGNVSSITSRKYDHVTTDEGDRENETIHEVGHLKPISSDPTRIEDDSSDANIEIAAGSELREEEEIYEDVQIQPKKLIKTVQNRDDDAFNVRPKKRRQTNSNDERGSKRQRDSELHNVKNSLSHTYYETENVPDRKPHTDTSYQRSPRPSHIHDHNNKYTTTDPWTRRKISEFIPDSLSQERCKVSNIRPTAKGYDDIQNSPICQHSFLGTLKELSRPCHYNDEIAIKLATRSHELSQYLRKDEKCPKLSSLIDILVRCAECRVSTPSKWTVMYILKTSKLFERKDVIDRLNQMKTCPTIRRVDETFIYGLLLVMKAMIDTVDLEESETTTARSLIESIINHRSEDVSLEEQSTVLKAIAEIFERKGKEQEQIGDFRGELFAETLPILPDMM
ncbi:hypothetical protein ACJMK2_012517 [Sinanodonta woodiana]|uniref:Uncharacterized protein n=1 Tax=Sinanodonta woodiana TaxID=1069815 RepID=A0ABD3VAR6_SINWO